MNKDFKVIELQMFGWESLNTISRRGVSCGIIPWMEMGGGWGRVEILQTSSVWLIWQPCGVRKGNRTITKAHWWSEGLCWAEARTTPSGLSLGQAPSEPMYPWQAAVMCRWGTHANRIIFGVYVGKIVQPSLHAPSPPHRECREEG